MVSKKNNTPNKPATNTTTNPNKPTTKIGRPKIEFDQKLFDKVLLAASPTPVVVKPGEGYWWNEPIEGMNLYELKKREKSLLQIYDTLTIEIMKRRLLKTLLALYIVKNSMFK
ncbi:hypothetical protein CsatA_024093 [Cannabis sativa]